MEPKEEFRDLVTSFSTVPSEPSRRAAITGTLYAPGTFASSRPAAPPIYRVPGGGRRCQEHIDIDIRLRAAASSKELLTIIGQDLGQFDTGNVVIAFTCAAKLDDGCEMSTLQPSQHWSALQAQLIACADTLEPRGMSMSAYAAAKLMYGDNKLLVRLADAGNRRGPDFGSTDLAKACWAFAKLRFVEEPEAAGFWKVAVREAARTPKVGRFVDVSMIAWAFAITDRCEETFFSEVSAVTRAAIDTLPPRSLAGISWACARVQHRDDRLFKLIAQRAHAIVHEFGAHDAAALCWAFSVARTTEVQLFNALGSQLVASGTLRRFSPPLAVELAWGFAAAGVHHEPLFAQLEELCTSHIDELETEDVAGFAWSFAILGRRNVAAFSALAAYTERFATRLRPEELKLLRWALTEVGFASQRLQDQLAH